MFEAAVRRTFAAAHAIRLPDGSFEPLHGHNWNVEVEVAADELDGIEVVIDFHELQAAVDAVTGPWHNRNLNDLEPFAGNRINPTAERVAWWIAQRVAATLPAHIRLVRVGVEEATGCVATFRP